MRLANRAHLLLAAALLAGCGGQADSPPAPKAVTGPHGVTAYVLPGEKGYVEILTEPGAKSTPKKKTLDLVVYFLKPDLKSPLDPAPTDVRAAIDAGEGGRKALALAAAPGSGPARSAGRFASQVGLDAGGELTGELSAQVDGQPVQIPFSIR
jgi:hypothetical protein